MAGTILELPWGSEKIVYTDSFGAREHFLGQKGMTPDGCLHRWAFSAGAIAAGETVEGAPAVATAVDNLAVQAAAAIGATVVNVTTEAAITADFYADGYIYTTNSAGVGYKYAIRSHLATTGAATMEITLHEPLIIAWTTSTIVGLMRNPFKDVVVGTAAANAAAILGVANAVVTDNDYFWVQVSGPANVLHEDTAAILGDGVGPGVNIAGAVQLHSSSEDTDKYPLGIEMAIATPAGEHGMIMLGPPGS